MSATPRRESEDAPGAENAKELIAADNVPEKLDLNPGDSVSRVDEVAKPGQDIQGSRISEKHASEIETATQLSETCLSDVPHVECSLTGIQKDEPGATKCAIINKEYSKDGVQKYDQSELEPRSGGTGDSSAPCTVCDSNQEAQDSAETKDVKGMCICVEHDMHASEIKTATQLSETCLSDVPHVESSLTGIQKEAPGATKCAIISEECSENGVQKYDQSELEPRSGGTGDPSAPCTVCDSNQEAQDSAETKNVKGMCICVEHDMHAPEIENATQLSEACLSDVSHVECSLTGIQKEAPGATKCAIINEECGENGVQKYDRSELQPRSGGTGDSSEPCTVSDSNQEAQDSAETKNVKGMSICVERDVRDHVSDCKASDIVSSLGTRSRRKRKIRESHPLLINSPGSRKPKSARDTSHVEQNSKSSKSYRTRSVKRTQDMVSEVVTDTQGLNLENTTSSLTGSHLQCVDKAEPSPSGCSSPNDAPPASFSTPVAGTTQCDVPDFCTTSGVQRKKQPLYVDPRLPKGWTRRVVQRKKGASAGKFDVYIFSPEGKKFRSQRELKTFLLGNGSLLNGDGFDFSVNGKEMTVQGEVGMNKNTVQGPGLMDDGHVNDKPLLEFNSENFRDKSEDPCHKNVPKIQEDLQDEAAEKLIQDSQDKSEDPCHKNIRKIKEDFQDEAAGKLIQDSQDKSEVLCHNDAPKMQEDIQNEVADKLLQPSSSRLKPNVRMSRRVKSAYFTSNGVSKRNSSRLLDSEVRNKKRKSVDSASSVEGAPTAVPNGTDSEEAEGTVPSQSDDTICAADDSGTACQSVPFAKNMLKSKIKTKWTPPRSPFNLVQEHLYHDPWQLLVATVFLNRTQGEVALPSLFKFFAAWPTPESIINASQVDIAQFLRPLGLQETRAYAIKRMSQDYVTKKWTDAKELFGIGKYGSDSHKIFCLNQWKCVRPTDHKLNKYVEWLWANHTSLGLC